MSAHKLNKTTRISTLITKLQELQSQEGDLPIVFACDSEGNSFNTIDPTDELEYALDGNVLVLYPSSDHIDVDDVLGHNSNTSNDEYDDDDDTKAVDEFFDDYSTEDYDDDNIDDEYY